MSKNYKKYYNKYKNNDHCDKCSDDFESCSEDFESCSNEENNNDMNNILLSLIASVNDNTNAIVQLVAQMQDNFQYQNSSDSSRLEDIGNNDVNVISFVDPDTLSGAVSNNESAVVNGAAASSTAISAAVALAIQNIIDQLGLVNGAEQ